MKGNQAGIRSGSLRALSCASSRALSCLLSYVLSCVCCVLLFQSARAQAAVAEINVTAAYAADDFQTRERIAQSIDAAPATIEVVGLSGTIASDKPDTMSAASRAGVATGARSKLRYCRKVNASIPKSLVFIKRGIFDKFDPGTRGDLPDAARAARQRGWKLGRDSDQDYEDRLAANRIGVSAIDPFVRRYPDRVGATLAGERSKQAANDELKVLLQHTTDRSVK